MILIVKTAIELKRILGKFKDLNKSIGFVPTMGSLHEGHLKLVRKSKRENDISVVSIFVNPTQFNDKKDLEKYPRNLEKDVELLFPTKVDIVYAPEVADVYPNDMINADKMDLGGLDELLEGEFRPGHFQGVAQVVKRLLEIVTPDRLYMGQKDFQQFTIIQYMIRQWKMDTQLIICPIIRESHGLAMSSRNVRLSPDGRQYAGIIYKTLRAVKRQKRTKTPQEIVHFALKKLNISPMEAEYFAIVDAHNLQPIDHWEDSNRTVACVAVWLEGVRLIDNIYLN